MMRLKYIVFDVGGMKQPLAWPSDLGLSHKDVARSVFTGIPISAGFCWAGVWAAHGESTSLELKSRPEDSALLAKYFGGAAASAGFLVGAESRSAAVPPSPAADAPPPAVRCNVCGERALAFAPGHHCTRHRRTGGERCPGTYKALVPQSPKEP